MRCLYLVFSGLSSWLACPAQAQQVAVEPTDSVWYAAANDRHVSSQTDSAGTCTEILRWADMNGLVRVFYPSGHLKEYVPYANLALGQRHGVVTTWFDSGQLEAKQPYEEGNRTGTLQVHYSNGSLKRQTQYVAGNELLGQCFDSTGQSVAYFPFEQLPLYPGGPAQLTKEINQALYRSRVRIIDFTRTIVVDIEFRVAEDGSIHTPRVALSSQVPALDQAVLAAVAKLRRTFTPARRDGRIVPCTYHIPVQFTPVMPVLASQKM